MCLAIPGRVMLIGRDRRPLMGKVDFGGIRKEVCLEYVPEANVGDYVIVHAGFGISIMDVEEATKTLELIAELDRRAAE